MGDICRHSTHVVGGAAAAEGNVNVDVDIDQKVVFSEETLKSNYLRWLCAVHQRSANRFVRMRASETSKGGVTTQFQHPPYREPKKVRTLPVGFQIQSPSGGTQKKVMVLGNERK